MGGEPSAGFAPRACLDALRLTLSPPAAPLPRLLLRACLCAGAGACACCPACAPGLRVMPVMRVAVAGLGAVGYPVVAALAHGSVPGLRLSAVSARDMARAASRLQAIGQPEAYVPIVSPRQLCEHADISSETW